MKNILLKVCSSFAKNKPVVLFLLIFLISIFKTQAQVTSIASPAGLKATTGYGLNKSRVYFINWDTNNDGVSNDSLSGGVNTTFTTPAGFVYTIKLDSLSVFNSAGTTLATTDANYQLRSTKSTDYFLNNIQFTYNGFPLFSAGNEQNIIGISNQSSVTGKPGSGNRVTFKITVTQKDPNGVVGNAAGLVIAGTETLTAATNEWYSITTSGNPIKMIDKYSVQRTSGTIRNYSTLSLNVNSSNSGRTIKVTNPIGTDGRGDAMLLAEDVSNIVCELKGGGGQHIAIGFIEELDYSDAPVSYGYAFHSADTKFTGGTFTNGNTALNTDSNAVDIASATGQIAKPTDPVFRLGADIDVENAPALPAAGAAPNADDLSGQDDEDALLNTLSDLNALFKLSYVNKSANIGYVTMWVDKDKNGTFDAGESVSKALPVNKSGFVIMDLSSLNIPLSSNYYTRLRLTSQNNIAATGYAPDGEVEDHQVNFVSNKYFIEGKVFDDVNANIPDGIKLDSVQVILRDATSNAIIETTYCSFEGQYLFAQLDNGNYKVEVVLPATTGYQHISSTDATPLNGMTDVVINNASQLNVNFGIQLPPVSAVSTVASQSNPGGTISVTVPAASFQTSNVGSNTNTSDFSGGTVDFIRITGFPTNTTSITINGTLYTSSTWPVGGVTIPYTNGTGPQWPILVDPISGTVDVVIPFRAIDNAGVEDISTSGGSVTLSFTFILPIKLLSFVGSHLKGINQLQWQTAIENNTAGFDIERSQNGRDWLKVGFVASNSSSLKTYQYFDTVNNSSINYYRLKQKNINNSFEYSNVLKLSAQTLPLTIYPNPVKGIVSISGVSIGSKAILTDVNGKILQSIKVTQTAFTINMSNLANGVYLLKLGSGVIEKIIKQ